MKGRSKDSTYLVIRDVRRNGVRSTEIMENLGSASEICRKYNVTDADVWAREYVQRLRDEEKGQIHKVLIPFNTDIIIDRDKQLSLKPLKLKIMKIMNCQNLWYALTPSCLQPTTGCSTITVNGTLSQHSRSKS